MKKRNIILFVLIALASGALAVNAQVDVLKWYPNDISFVLEVDFSTLKSVLGEKYSHLIEKEFSKQAKVDFLDNFSEFFIGFTESSDEEDIYFFLKGKMNAAQIADYVRIADDKVAEVIVSRKTVFSIDVVSVQGGRDGDEFMFADAGDGWVVGGTPGGIVRYAQVKSGAVSNSSGNSRMIELESRVPANSTIRLYGSPTEADNEVRGLAAGINWIQDVLHIDLFLEPRSEKALNEITNGLNMLRQMAPMIDQTGKLADLVNSMEITSDNNSISISLNIPKETLEHLQNNAQDMFMGSMQAGSQKHDK